MNKSVTHIFFLITIAMSAGLVSAMLPTAPAAQVKPQWLVDLRATVEAGGHVEEETVDNWLVCIKESISSQDFLESLNDIYPMFYSLGYAELLDELLDQIAFQSIMSIQRIDTRPFVESAHDYSEEQSTFFARSTDPTWISELKAAVELVQTDNFRVTKTQVDQWLHVFVAMLERGGCKIVREVKRYFEILGYAKQFDDTCRFLIQEIDFEAYPFELFCSESFDGSWPLINVHVGMGVRRKSNGSVAETVSFDTLVTPRGSIGSSLVSPRISQDFSGSSANSLGAVRAVIVVSRNGSVADEVLDSGGLISQGSEFNSGSNSSGEFPLLARTIRVAWGVKLDSDE